MSKPIVTSNHSKRLRKAMGIVGGKNAKRFRRWLKHSQQPHAAQARKAIAAQFAAEQQ